MCVLFFFIKYSDRFVQSDINFFDEEESDPSFRSGTNSIVIHFALFTEFDGVIKSTPTSHFHDYKLNAF